VIFVADTHNNRIRRLALDASGTNNWLATSVAGSGSHAFADGNGVQGSSFDMPSSVGLLHEDGAACLLVLDTGNHRLRQITIDQREDEMGRLNNGQQLAMLQKKGEHTEEEIQEIECTPTSIEQLKDMIMREEAGYCLRFNRPLHASSTPSHAEFDRVWDGGHPGFDIDLHTGASAEECDLCRRNPDLTHDERLGQIMVMRLKPHGTAEMLGLRRGDRVVRCYSASDGRVSSAARALLAADCTTISGNGQPESASALTPLGDGPAMGVAVPRFHTPGGFVVDAAHQLVYVADTCNHCVRVLILDPSHALYGHVLTIAGSTDGQRGHRDGYGAGPGGSSSSSSSGSSTASSTATTALFDSPSGLALNPLTSELFVADTGNDCVRRLRLLLVDEEVSKRLVCDSNIDVL
jgi:hypothetical protein